MKPGWILVFLLVLSAPGLSAGSAADRKRDWNVYLKLTSDGDLYTGEGSASAGDFKGGYAAAEQAARTRARAALAESIRVRVSSETTSTLQGDSLSVTETVKAVAKSSSDIQLENVSLKTFKDQPEEGDVLVVAYLSKENYRRQLAGKNAPLYRPENGVRLGMDWIFITWMNPLDYEDELHQKAVPDNSMTFLRLFEPSLDFVWNNFTAGFSMAVGGDQFSILRTYNPSASNPALVYLVRPLNVDLNLMVKLGYDWTPLNWKLQPFVPLRLEYSYLRLALGSGGVLDSNGNPIQYGATRYSAGLFGASAGLGLRYWANDNTALEAAGIASLGFNTATLADADGRPLRFARPGPLYVAESSASLTGLQFRVGLLWSGF